MPGGGIEEGAREPGEVGDDDGAADRAGFMQAVVHESMTAPTAAVSQMAIGFLAGVEHFAGAAKDRIGERYFLIFADIDGIHGVSTRYQNFAIFYYGFGICFFTSSLKNKYESRFECSCLLHLRVLFTVVLHVLISCAAGCY